MQNILKSSALYSSGSASSAPPALPACCTCTSTQARACLLGCQLGRVAAAVRLRLVKACRSHTTAKQELCGGCPEPCCDKLLDADCRMFIMTQGCSGTASTLAGTSRNEGLLSQLIVLLAQSVPWSGATSSGCSVGSPPASHPLLGTPSPVQTVETRLTRAGVGELAGVCRHCWTRLSAP